MTGQSPSLNTVLGYTFGDFSRLLSGTSRQDDSISIITHVGVLETSVLLDNKTAFRFSLPFGVSRSENGSESSDTQGLGDLSLVGSRTVSRGQFRLSLGAGAVLPTGRYEPSNSVSASELITGADGSLDLEIG
ncbi:MAG: transporter, partial [Myxococcota bacterium]